MTTLTLTAVLQLSMATCGAQSYSEAYQLSKETGCPLVVVVGADWCPACQQMTHSILPEVKRSGCLKNVSYVYVNFDREQSLAQKLTGGGSIPQLIVFTPTDSGWRRKKMLGARSASEIESFIKQPAAKQVAAETPPTKLTSR